MAAFAFASAISLLAAAPASGAAAAHGGVVSLNLCTDELVLLVVAPVQIRSVSYLSQMPEESALWRQARRYRANDGSMLAAAAVRPSLVVTMGGGGRDPSRLAAAVGARLLNLPYPNKLADVIASVRSVGRATGNSTRAEALVADMQTAITSAPRRTASAMWIDGAGRTLSPSGLGADWLRLAGLTQRAVAGDKVTLETMVTRAPPVVVRSRYRARQMSSATSWLRHPAVRRIVAARTLSTDGRPWTCAGPTLLPEILRLRRALAG